MSITKCEVTGIDVDPNDRRRLIVPPNFAEDHEVRGLATGILVKSNARGWSFMVTRAEAEEWRSDADLYSDLRFNKEWHDTSASAHAWARGARTARDRAIEVIQAFDADGGAR